MPIFDLICPKCRKKMKNVLHPIDDEHPKCPKCKTKMTVDYVDMLFGIVKRGDGWTPGAGSDRRKT